MSSQRSVQLSYIDSSEVKKRRGRSTEEEIVVSSRRSHETLINTSIISVAKPLVDTRTRLHVVNTGESGERGLLADWFPAPHLRTDEHDAPCWTRIEADDPPPQLFTIGISTIERTRRRRHLPCLFFRRA